MSEPKRVTALTLRNDDLREQRDRAWRYRIAWLSAKRRAVNNDWRAVEAWEAADDALRERDEARAQVVACQTAADDLRAAVEALAAEWADQPNDYDEDTEAEIECGLRLRAALDATTPARRAGSVHTSDSGASVDPSATPDLLGPQIGAESLKEADA